MIDKVIGTAVGLATGFITKKIIIGTSDNKFRKLIGSIFEFGVINIVAQRQNALKAVGRFLLQSFLQKKEINFRNRD